MKIQKYVYECSSASKFFQTYSEGKAVVPEITAQHEDVENVCIDERNSYFCGLASNPQINENRRSI
jgi:hypothetical protein